MKVSIWVSLISIRIYKYGQYVHGSGPFVLYVWWISMRSQLQKKEEEIFDFRLDGNNEINK